MSKDRRTLFGLLIAASGVRVLFLFFLPAQSLSIDLRSWMHVAFLLSQGLNPYHASDVLNWPPLWMVLISLMMNVSLYWHVHFIDVLKGFLMLVEAGLLVALYGCLRQYGSPTSIQKLLLVGVALNPICILQVTQHCNFDVLVALWVTLFLKFLINANHSKEPLDWLTACFFLGLAILTKTVPAVLIPLCVLHSRAFSRQTKLLGAVFILGPIALALSILFALTPADIIEHVILYRSFPGWFGFTGLIAHWGPDAWIQEYTWTFEIGMTALFVVVTRAAWLASAWSDRRLVLWSVLLLMVIPALGPGYSPQYIFWIVPGLVLAWQLDHEGIWRSLLVSFFIIATITYVAEYAVIPSHGAFLTTRYPNVLLTYASRLFSHQWPQTVLRLPLFISYLSVLGYMLRLLFRATPQSS